MKTFILAIFGLLALANAQDMEYKIDQSEARKANPEPEKAYAHPGYKPPAKYVQFKLCKLLCTVLNVTK